MAQRCYGYLDLIVDGKNYTLAPGTLRCGKGVGVGARSTDDALWSFNDRLVPLELSEKIKNDSAFLTKLTLEISKALPKKHCGGCHTREINGRS